MNQCLALIPARSGSKRIKDKNIQVLNNHPLIAYTIIVALKCGIFSHIIVSTDSQKIAQIAKYYGADVPFIRPKKYATDTSPDIKWVKFTLERLKEQKIEADYFAILRPTSPFRKVETIKRAWQQFYSNSEVNSLRAVEKCRQHPAKMWLVDKKKNRMRAVMENPQKNDIPWHSQQYQALSPIYCQNASLEIAWTRLPLDKNSISGDEIMPFFTKGYEGYDINDEKDWVYAERLVEQGRVRLPTLKQKPYQE